MSREGGSEGSKRGGGNFFKGFCHVAFYFWSTSGYLKALDHETSQFGQSPYLGSFWAGKASLKIDSSKQIKVVPIS